MAYDFFGLTIAKKLVRSNILLKISYLGYVTYMVALRWRRNKVNVVEQGKHNKTLLGTVE